MSGNSRIFFLFLMFLPFMLYSKEVKLSSQFLNQERIIDVYLPDNYDNSLNYPCIYVLDGDKLGSLVSGITLFNEGFDLFPEIIIISIRQDTTRWTDCGYNSKGELTVNSSNFYNFISKELIPYVDLNYSVNNYRIILGHSFTANFINYFLIDKDISYFNSYIAISPYYSPDLVNKVLEKVNSLKSIVSYYVSYSENDLSGHINSVRKADKIFKSIKSKNFNYKMDYIQGKGHISMVPISTSNAIDHTFFYSKPIFKVFKIKNLREFKGSYVAFVKKYYSNLNLIYSIDIEYRIEDLEYVSFAVNKYSRDIEVKEFGEFCIQNKPNAYVGYYLLGEYYEKLNLLERALFFYEKGYSTLGDNCLNKSDFYREISKIKVKLTKKQQNI